jgi:hypothetical protein
MVSNRGRPEPCRHGKQQITIQREQLTKKEQSMPPQNNEETLITLQVGSELRVDNEGTSIMDNPGLELAREPSAADATISYRFDAARKQHILRLLDPVADHKHMKRHRPND